jgi:ATP-binding cassette subfamily A (ABC1) protein 3
MNALLNKLTGKEMLFLFARLRGIPSNLIPQNVKRIIEMIDIKKHANKCIENYSGGNKKKLLLALAIIGNSPVIFLDKPAVGVNPTARRNIWSTLDHVKETII